VELRRRQSDEALAAALQLVARDLRSPSPVFRCAASLRASYIDFYTSKTSAPTAAAF